MIVKSVIVRFGGGQKPSCPKNQDNIFKFFRVEHLLGLHDLILTVQGRL